MSLKRYLEPGEIDEIVSELPIIDGFDPVTDKAVRELNQQQLKTVLSQHKMYADNPKYMNALKERLANEYRATRVAPGSPVGMWATDAIIVPIMQLAISAIKPEKAGGNISNVVGRIKDLIYATLNPKVLGGTISFKEPIYADNILSTKRVEMEQVTLFDLVYDYIPDTPKNLDVPDGCHWYKSYKEVFPNRIIRYPTHIMRLYLKLDMMVSHKITSSQLRSKVEKMWDGQIICVVSPIIKIQAEIGSDEYNSEAAEIAIKPSYSYRDNVTHRPPNKKRYRTKQVIYLDIIPIEAKITEIVVKRLGGSAIIDVSLMFLKLVFLADSNKLIIKGITGLESIKPISHTVWSGIYKITQIEENLWSIIHNYRKMDEIGMKQERIKNLLEFMGMVIQKESNTGMEVSIDRVPFNLPKDKVTPKGLYDYYINRDKDDELAHQSERRKEQFTLRKVDKFATIIIHRPPSKFYKLYNHYQAKYKGYGLMEIIAKDDVDPYHTTSTNINEVYEYFGVEGVRDYLLKELYDILCEEGRYVYVGHVILLVDMMTYNGKLLKIKYSIADAPINIITMATAQRAVEILSTHAPSGVSIPLTGSAANVLVGTPTLVGNAYRMSVNPTVKAKVDKLIEINATPSATAFDKTIEQYGYNTSLYGAVDDVLGGEEMAFDESYEEEGINISAALPPPTKVTVQIRNKISNDITEDFDEVVPISFV